MAPTAAWSRRLLSRLPLNLYASYAVQLPRLVIYHHRRKQKPPSLRLYPSIMVGHGRNPPHRRSSHRAAASKGTQ